MFWDVIVSGIVKEWGTLYEHMSNSEWLPIYSCLNLQIQTHCEW